MRGEAVDALAQRVARLCESTFAAVEGLRGVAEQALPLPRLAASVAAAARPLLEQPGTPLVGAGLVVAPGAVPGVGHWMEWWHRGRGGDGPVGEPARGAPAERQRGGAIRRLEPVLDPAADDFYDYTALPWFAVPRATGARHVTGPYVDTLCTTEYTLTFTVPLFAPGREFVGVVGADIVVDWLERRLLPLLHRAGGPAALVNTDGRIIAANRPHLMTGTVLTAPGDRHPLPALPLAIWSHVVA